jgi:hypothetical protein
MILIADPKDLTARVDSIIVNLRRDAAFVKMNSLYTWIVIEKVRNSIDFSKIQLKV